MKPYGWKNQKVDCPYCQNFDRDEGSKKAMKKKERQTAKKEIKNECEHLSNTKNDGSSDV